MVVLLWAGNFPLGKLALHEIGPLMITAARAVIAAPILFVLARLTAPLSRPLTARDYRAFVILGWSGLVLNTTIWFWGLRSTTAVNAGILGAASPVLVALAATMMGGERLRPAHWAGTALSAAAVVLVVTKGSFGVLATVAINRGDVAILASQLAWVTYSLYSRMAASTLPPVWIMAGAHVASAVVLVPLAMIFEPWHSPAAAPFGWLVILYGATAITLGHLWFYAAIRKIGAGRAATFVNLMPFVVIVLSWLIAGESVHAYHVAGATLVIAGVYLTTR